MLRSVGTKWTSYLKNNESAPYLVVTVVLVLVAFLGLYNDGFVAGGDIWPGYIIGNENYLKESLSLWGQLVTGMGSTQFSAVVFVWSLFATVVQFFGFSPYTAQFLFFMALLLVQGLGLVYFGRTIWRDNKLIAIFLGIALPVSLFNTLTFINPIGAFAIGYLPYFTALLYKYLKHPKNQLLQGLKLGLGTIGLYVISGTPPMAVYFIIWVVVCVALAWVRWKNAKTTWKMLSVAFLVSVCLHAWWAFAGYMTLYGSSDTIQQTYSGPLAWAFVHKQASLPNLLSMQGFWSWANQDYFPWSGSFLDGYLYYSLYVPAIFAVLGLVFSKSNKKYVLLGVVLVSLFVAKGLHAPFGWINEKLYLHLPLYWLFRDPQVEFNISLYLALFTLACLGIVETLKYVDTQIKTFVANNVVKRTLNAAASIIIAVLVLSNGYAFVTGSFLNTNASGSVNPIVKVPKYWQEVADYLKANNDGKRVMLFPNDDFYQMHYKWGFYGTDEVAQSLFKQPVLRLEPTTVGYLAGSKEFQNSLANLLQDVSTDPMKDISPTLNNMNVGWILHRRDVVFTSPGRNILSDAYVTSYLGLQKSIVKMASFGELDLYKVQGNTSFVQGYTGVAHFDGEAPNANDLTRVTDLNVPWVNEKTDITKVNGFYSPASINTLVGKTLDTNGRVMLTPETVTLALEPDSDKNLVLHSYGASYVDGNGKTVRWSQRTEIPIEWHKKELINIALPTGTYNVETKDLRVGVSMVLGEMQAPRGGQKVPVEVYAGQKKLKTTIFSDLGDCNSTRGHSLADVGIKSEASGKNGVVLSASSHLACVNSHFAMDDAGKVVVEFNYKNLKGHAPQVKVQLNDKDIYNETLDSEGHFFKVFDMAEKGKLSVFVYSNATDDLKTVNEYSSLNMYNLQKEKDIDVYLDFMPNVLDVSSGLFKLEQPTHGKELLAGGNFTDLSFGELFNANAYIPATIEAAGIKGTVKDGVLNLKADFDAAGMQQKIYGVEGKILHLHAESRNIKGNEAPSIRVYNKEGKQVWQSLYAPDNQEWQTVDHTLRLSPNDTEITLSIYAYANPSGPSEKEYRNVSLRQWPGDRTSVLFIGQTEDVKATNVVWEKKHNKYSATLDTETRFLSLNVAYHKGWHVESHGKELKWSHVKVNGITNGWVVPKDAPKDVTIVFGPNTPFVVLEFLALFTVLCIIFFTLVMPRIRKSSTK